MKHKIFLIDKIDKTYLIFYNLIRIKSIFIIIKSNLLNDVK